MPEQELLPAEATESPSKAVIERAADGVRFGELAMSDPGQVVVMARKIAGPLAQLIDEKRLFAVISQRKFVYVEGWATCGAMLGVVPQLEHEEESATIPGEFIATVVAVRSSDGMILGRAKASCGPDESTWKNRSRQARRSMAQTRATGKVFRLLFSWVMQLAGYETTPFEELDQGAPAYDNATRDSAAPKTPPRAERKNTKPVTVDDVKNLSSEWKSQQRDPTADGWKAWVAEMTGRVFDVTKTGHWTIDDLNACWRALGIPEE